MDKKVRLYYLLCILLLFHCSALAQISFEQKVLDTFLSHKVKKIVFEEIQPENYWSEFGLSQKIKIGKNNLYFYHSIPDLTEEEKNIKFRSKDSAFANFLNNGGENGFYPRGVVYKGKFISVDSGFIDTAKPYLIGSWLDLFRCLTYRSGDYQYIFSQWFLHFTNGSHPPSLITILLFKNGNYIGVLNYISEDENFEDLIGYYNSDNLIGIPYVVNAEDSCVKYGLLSVDAIKMKFKVSGFAGENTITICE